jgi:hypothetical protein
MLFSFYLYFLCISVGRVKSRRSRGDRIDDDDSPTDSTSSIRRLMMGHLRRPRETAIDISQRTENIITMAFDCDDIDDENF